MANQWQDKFSLQKMVEEYNKTVTELEELKQSSTQVNEATAQKITELEQSIDEQLQTIQTELNSKISSVTAEDLGLGNVDNTSDTDKPVSTAQAEAIQTAKTEAMADMLTSVEEEIASTEGEPEVSPLIDSLIREIVQEIGAQSGVTPYGIATKLVLGVVKASEEVSVDPTTGAMTVVGYGNLKNTIQSLVKGVGTLEELSTETKTDIVSAVNELFQSVSNGKALVASAITDKGVVTQPDATFETMANNVTKLQMNTEEKYLFHIPDEEFVNNLKGLPYWFENGQACMHNGELYIQGGWCNGINYGNHFYKFTGNENRTSWEQLASPRYGCSFGDLVNVVNPNGVEELHLIGGNRYWERYHVHTVYDDETGTWIEKSDHPLTLDPPGGLVAVTKDSNGKDVIHIMNGIYHYRLNYGAGEIAWVRVADLPYSVDKDNSCCVVFENEIYIFTSPSYLPTTNYFGKLVGDNWELWETVLESPLFLDYSPMVESIYSYLCVYGGKPHLLLLEELNTFIMFVRLNKDYQYGGAVDKTYALIYRPHIDPVFDLLFACSEDGGGTDFQNGQMVFDEVHRILYQIGGNQSSKTQTHFRIINYEIYAKLCNK